MPKYFDFSQRKYLFAISATEPLWTESLDEMDIHPHIIYKKDTDDFLSFKPTLSFEGLI